MMLRLITRLLTIVICTAFAPQLWAQQANQPSENLIKAAFLYSFTKFVEWPPAAFADSTDPIIIGILGEDPFGDLLDQAVEDKTSKGRKIRIERYGQIDSLDTCHILFVSSSEKENLKQVLEHLEGLSVLTVGDMKDFARLGGAIGYVMVRNRVRLEINTDATRRAGLKTSSKLLIVAKIVEEKP